jgi:hypothetical protein
MEGFVTEAAMIKDAIYAQVNESFEKERNRTTERSFYASTLIDLRIPKSPRLISLSFTFNYSFDNIIILFFSAHLWRNNTP